jgi:uncharacterized protein YbjT (DUF2867 family)
MPKENSKILISAASGKVGQHVVTQLAQRKCRRGQAFTARPKRPRFGRLGSTLRFSTSRAPRALPPHSKVSTHCSS